MNDSVLPSSVKVAEFERQMAYIKQKGYRGTSLEEAIDSDNRNKLIVALTFDDGYIDNYENVMPILNKYGFTATIFVTCNFIDGKIKWHNSNVVSPGLRWKHLEEMITKGLRIGSHSVAHKSLTNISKEYARQEIENSKKILEQKLGFPIRSFAYPFGDFNIQVKSMVQKAGYDMATALRVPRKICEDRYCISRIGINARDNIISFRIKLSLFYSWMYKNRIDFILNRNLYYKLLK